MSKYVHIILFPILLFAQNSSLQLKYQEYYPFHEKLETPMPTIECNENGKNCQFVSHEEDNLAKFKSLLFETERQEDVNSLQFLNSPLGRYYQSLKSFVEIQESFKSCQEDSKMFTEEALSDSLQRLSANAARSSLLENCESLQDQQILEQKNLGFINEFVELQLGNELILDSLKRSITARIAFEKKFSNQEITREQFAQELLNDLCLGITRVRTSGGRRVRNSQGNICSDKDNNLLKMLIEESILQLSGPKNIPTPMGPGQIRNDLNSRIAQMNYTLQEFNRKKDELQRSWEVEDIEDERTYQKDPVSSRRYTRQIAPRKRRARQQELSQLKGEAYDEYVRLYSSLHDDGAGHLLQTNAVKTSSNITRLEEMSSKWLGFAGFEPEVLSDENTDFPLLHPIDDAVVGRAVRESLSRTKGQVQDLLARRRDGNPRNHVENLEYLIMANPTSAGHVLINNPQYANKLCEILQGMAVSERNRTMLEFGTFMVLGVGITIAGIGTLGGALPMAATLAGVVGGVALTVAEQSYMLHESARYRRRQTAILNAYLSGTGDDQSIEEIRSNWQKMLESDHFAKMGQWFGLFDILGVPHAARAGAFLKLANTIDGLETGLSKTWKLLYLISKEDSYILSIRGLMEHYSREQIGSLLNFLATLSKDKQVSLLQSLGQLTSGDLNAFSQLQSVRRVLSREEQSVLNDITAGNTSRRVVSSLAIDIARGPTRATSVAELKQVYHSLKLNDEQWAAISALSENNKNILLNYINSKGYTEDEIQDFFSFVRRDDNIFDINKICR